MCETCSLQHSMTRDIDYDLQLAGVGREEKERVALMVRIRMRMRMRMRMMMRVRGVIQEEVDDVDRIVQSDREYLGYG